MNIIINNLNFQIESYHYLSNGIVINILFDNTTIDDIKNAITKLTTIKINNQTIMKDMILESITLRPDKNYYEIIFNKIDLQTQVDFLKEDITYIKGKLQEILSKIDSNNGG